MLAWKLHLGEATMRAFAFAVLIAASPACSLGSSTSGEDHHATFSYSTLSCLFGCTVAEPMMAGTQEIIHVSAPSIPPVTVVSNQPAVVTVGTVDRSCCSQGAQSACRNLTAADACTADETPTLDITVTAAGAGSSDLTLVGANGTTWDGTTLTVEEPAGLAVTCSNKTVPSTMVQGQSCTIAWSATDSAGNPLMATSGVTLSSSDTSIVAFETLLGSPVASLEASQAFLANPSLVAVGVGGATITATARQATLAVPIQVN